MTGSHLVFAISLIPLVAACGVDPAMNTLDSQGAGAEADAAVDTELSCPEGQVFCGACIAIIEPTAASILERVLRGSCAFGSACHGGVRAQENLDLSSVDALMRTTVGAPSKQADGALIIRPGAPEDSYLISKLRGSQLATAASDGSASTRMPPPPSEPLCDAKIAALEAWIRAGASD